MSKDDEVHARAAGDDNKNNSSSKEKEMNKSKTNRLHSGKGSNRKKPQDPDGRQQTSGDDRDRRKKSNEKMGHCAHDALAKEKDPKKDNSKIKERKDHPSRKDHGHHSGIAAVIVDNGVEGKLLNNDKSKRDKKKNADSTPATNGNTKSEPIATSTPTHENKSQNCSTDFLHSGQAMCCQVPSLSNQVREVDRDISGIRLRQIRQYEKKWMNGTILTFYFYRESDHEKLAGSKANENVVRRAFRKWETIPGMSIRFQEVDDINDAMVRIAFEKNNGDWSGVGRDIIDYYDPFEPTMNFGSDLAGVPNLEERFNIALHEIGHTLGFGHEHQSPFSNIVWDVNAVYDMYAQYGWTKEMVNTNILNKYPEETWMGLEWDPNSVMHYWFPKGLIKEPAQYYENGLFPEFGLSSTDRAEVQKYYGTASPTGNDTDGPKISELPLLVADESQRIKDAKPGSQSDFLIQPERTGYYSIETMGYRIDTSIVLFQQVDRTKRLEVMAGDDDSGRGKNAFLRVRLLRGNEYVLKVRIVSTLRGRKASVLMRSDSRRRDRRRDDGPSGRILPIDPERRRKNFEDTT